MSQERRVQELNRDIAEQQSAQEALKQALISTAARQQHAADAADKERLLSLDALHAPPAPLGHHPRPPALCKPENARGQNQREGSAMRTVTPRDATGLKSPRKVCGRLLLLLLL